MENLINKYGLQNSQEKDNLQFFYVSKDKEKWLSKRQYFVGASEVASALGKHPYKSQYELYQEKLTGEVDDISNKVVVRRGLMLEELIMKELSKQSDRATKWLKPKHSIVNTRFTSLIGDLDCLEVKLDETVIHEIKYVSEYGAKLWVDDKPPVYYYYQAMTYMIITGLRKCEINALFDSDWQIRTYVIDYNENVAQEIINGTIEFMANVQSQHKPRLNVELDQKKIVDMEIEETIESDKIDTLAIRYIELLNQYKVIKSELDEVEKTIKDYYYNDHLTTTKNCGIEIKSTVFSRSSFNKDKFKDDYGDEVYKKYTTESQVSRFSIKERL